MLTGRTARQKPRPGSGIDWGHPLAVGLQGCWLLNEGGGPFARELKHNLPAALSAATRWVGPGAASPTPLEAGLDVFHGGVSVSFVTTPFVPDFHATRCTVAAMVQHITVASGQICAVARSYDGSSVPFVLGTIQSGSAYEGFSFFDGGWHKTGGTDIRGDGKVHLIVGSYDGTTLRYYLDGQLDASTSYTGAMSTNNTSPLVLGQYVQDLNSWEGYIFAAWFWNRALSMREVIRLHENPYTMILPKRSLWMDVQAAPAGGGRTTKNTRPFPLGEQAGMGFQIGG